MPSDCSQPKPTSDIYSYMFTKNKNLSEAKIVAMTEYIRENYDSMVKLGDYYFDTNSLKAEICLNKCLECEYYQPENCCQGSPYPLVDEQQEWLLEIFKDIVNFMPEEQRPIVHHNLLEEGKANYSDLFNKHNTIISHKGCILAVTIDDKPRCGIHYYCLEHGLNPFKYKPYICSLFPIFAVETPSGEKYVFSHTAATSGFSLYFWTLGNRMCILKEKAKKVVTQTEYKSKYYYTVHRDKMIEDNLLDAYNPAYIEQESVIKYFFGEDIYAQLSEIMKKKEN